MSRHDPAVTLRQVADHARRAQELCTQTTLAGILADWQKRAAFERIMEVLGEAVKRLPPELMARYPGWTGAVSPGCVIASVTVTTRLIMICSGRRWRQNCDRVIV